MKKQNIVMIHAESYNGRLIGCLGQFPAISGATPNIDALAARGAMFPETYTTHPICCPSRANMWSGTYTHKCECAIQAFCEFDCTPRFEFET